MDSRLEELKTLRDEIRVELHLASRDLRDEWEGLDKQIPDSRALADQLKEIKDASVETFDRLAHDVRRLRDKLLGRKQADATPVSSLMTRPVINLPIDRHPGRRRAEDVGSDVGCLVVLDGAGHIAGLITDRDCLMAAHTRGQRLEAMRVDSAMSRSVYSCRPEDSLAAVEDVMKAHQIRRMPVVDAQGLPQGMITI